MSRTVKRSPSSLSQNSVKRQKILSLDEGFCTLHRRPAALDKDALPSSPKDLEADSAPLKPQHVLPPCEFEHPIAQLYNADTDEICHDMRYESMLIGRAKGMLVDLSLPNESYLSREHALIRYVLEPGDENEKFYDYFELKSFGRNGTLVDGKAVAGACILYSGSIIEFPRCSTRLRVKFISKRLLEAKEVLAERRRFS